MRHHHFFALLALTLVIGIVGVLVGTPQGRHAISVVLHGPGHAKVVLPPQAQDVAKTKAQENAKGNTEAAHSLLRAEPKAATAPGTLAHNDALKPPSAPLPPVQVPLASVHQAGCRTLEVRNQSSRNAHAILGIVLHQTISPDNGWNGVLGNVRWFDSQAAQASAHYIVARTGGQCAYVVPETRKAWHVAGFNSSTIGIEVTETGNEGSYLVGAGRAKVIQLMIAIHHRWGVPYRHGLVSGCNWIRTGVVEHRDLGQCGGGHGDDAPYSIDSLIAAAKRLDQPVKPTRRQLIAQRSKVRHTLRLRHCSRHRNRGDCQRLYRRNALLNRQIGRKR
jgi:hypothetical protein